MMSGDSEEMYGPDIGAIRLWVCPQCLSVTDWTAMRKGVFVTGGPICYEAVHYNPAARPGREQDGVKMKPLDAPEYEAAYRIGGHAAVRQLLMTAVRHGEAGSPTE